MTTTMKECPKECPICMDDICLNVNCVTTECGHQFHTSCLMQNVAHNGFGCPYCRNTLAEYVKDEEDSDYESDFDEDDEEEEEEDEEEEEEEEPVGDNEMALHGMRQLFRRVNNDIEDAAEREREARVVSAEEMTWTLVDAGYNMTDVVKAFMISGGYHLIYPDDTTEEDEFVEKVENHMEKVLHYEIPIVPRQFAVFPEVEEKQESINFHRLPLSRLSRYQFDFEITSFTNLIEEELDDIAEPKTNKNKTLYDNDEYL